MFRSPSNPLIDLGSSESNSAFTKCVSTGMEKMNERMTSLSVQNTHGFFSAGQPVKPKEPVRGNKIKIPQDSPPQVAPIDFITIEQGQARRAAAAEARRAAAAEARTVAEVEARRVAEVEARRVAERAERHREVQRLRQEVRDFSAAEKAKGPCVIS